jgi:hypothetical protein
MYACGIALAIGFLLSKHLAKEVAIWLYGPPYIVLIASMAVFATVDQYRSPKPGLRTDKRYRQEQSLKFLLFLLVMGAYGWFIHNHLAVIFGWGGAFAISIASVWEKAHPMEEAPDDTSGNQTTEEDPD